MASKEDIKKAILEVAGNPEGGIIHSLADAWADAIVKLDAPEETKAQPSVKAESPAKETRVTKPDETR